jgi:hypothetical protein
MHDEHTTPQSTEHAEKLGYEDTDISIPVLMKWGFFLVVFVGVSSIVVLGIYALLVPQYANRSANTALVRKIPAEDVPQLQPDPVKDIKDFRSRETAHITGYGTWKDGDGKDVNYIPISRAMQIVEAKGLPIESPDAAKNDVTPPAVDRGFLDNPLPDGSPTPVQGKVGPENGDSMDESSYARHTPGM